MALLEYVTVLLKYLDLSISVAEHSKDLEGPALPLSTPLKRDTVLEDFTKFRDLHLYNMPIMPAVRSKLAYYASIMLDALACLLCLKLCRHNQRRPKHDSHKPSYLKHIQAIINN